MSNLSKKQILAPNYFPIVSELKSSSIYGNYFEVNILLEDTKMCSFDCSYCSLGKTETKINAIKNLKFNSSLKITDSLSSKLNNVVLSNTNVDTILISGNGEPTLHPQFNEISESIYKWKNSISSSTKIVLLTNGAHFYTKKSLNVTQYYDEIYFKIDCSDDITLKKLNSPIVRQSIDKLLFSAQKIDNISVQTMFVDGPTNNVSDSHIEDYLEIIGILKPKNIIIETLKHDINSLKPVTDIFLYNIAQKIRKRIECNIHINV